MILKSYRNSVPGGGKRHPRDGRRAGTVGLSRALVCPGSDKIPRIDSIPLAVQVPNHLPGCLGPGADTIAVVQAKSLLGGLQSLQMGGNRVRRCVECSSRTRYTIW